MAAAPFPEYGDEPEGLVPLPAGDEGRDEEEGARQGLYVTLPAEELTLGNGGPDRPRRPEPARAGAGPSIAALASIIIPAGALDGDAGPPGEVAGFGLADHHDSRDLAAAAARHPATRWCVTVVNPDGTAAAHGCAACSAPGPRDETR